MVSSIEFFSKGMATTSRLTLVLFANFLFFETSFWNGKVCSRFIFQDTKTPIKIDNGPSLIYGTNCLYNQVTTRPVRMTPIPKLRLSKAYHPLFGRIFGISPLFLYLSLSLAMKFFHNLYVHHIQWGCAHIFVYRVYTRYHFEISELALCN